MDLASPSGALSASKALFLLLDHILEFRWAADDRTAILDKTICPEGCQWRLDALGVLAYFEGIREKVLRWVAGCVVTNPHPRLASHLIYTTEYLNNLHLAKVINCTLFLHISHLFSL